jgi:hypothetical protein
VEPLASHHRLIVHGDVRTSTSSGDAEVFWGRDHSPQPLEDTAVNGVFARKTRALGERILDDQLRRPQHG